MSPCTAFSFPHRLTHSLILPPIQQNPVPYRWINDENPLLRAAATAARSNFATPLDEVDAAARILDPMFAPLIDAENGKECRPTYGAFLKDYFGVEW